LDAVYSRPFVLSVCVALVEHAHQIKLIYLEDIEADSTTVNIKVGVETWRLKFDGGCNVWVVGGKRNRDLERKASINLVQSTSAFQQENEQNSLSLLDPQLSQPIQTNSHRSWGKQTDNST